MGGQVTAAAGRREHAYIFLGPPEQAFSRHSWGRPMLGPQMRGRPKQESAATLRKGGPDGPLLAFNGARAALTNGVAGLCEMGSTAHGAQHLVIVSQSVQWYSAIEVPYRFDNWYCSELDISHWEISLPARFDHAR